MEDAPAALVVDNGSGIMKTGFAGDTGPRSVFNTVVARNMAKPVMVGSDSVQPSVGNITQAHMSYKGIRRIYEKCGEHNDGRFKHNDGRGIGYPIERGIITAWDKMEQIWHYAYFSDLQISSEDHCIMLTDSPTNPKANRERMTQIHFETFSVPGMYINNQAGLSLYASGRTTGCVLDSGDGVSHTVPLLEGFTLPHATKRLDLAGHDLSDWMMKCLIEKGYTFANIYTKADCEIVRDVKEKLCYVTLDYEEEVKKVKGLADLVKDYELPDGNVIKVDTARFKCPEALFQPSMLGKKADGIHQMCFGTFMAMTFDDPCVLKKVRKDMYQNIVCSGGSTMYKGFPERLGKEISALAPASTAVKIIAPPERKYSAWVGGSMLSALGTFQSMLITKAEYADNGPAIVHRKCFS